MINQSSPHVGQLVLQPTPMRIVYADDSDVVMVTLYLYLLLY
jgi:hypothetical protein